jgi:hypothetical protein
MAPLLRLMNKNGFSNASIQKKGERVQHNRQRNSSELLSLPAECKMYKEFVKRDERVMRNLSHVLKNSVEPEVALTLGESETSIRFVESHRHDIQAVLQGMD